MTTPRLLSQMPRPVRADQRGFGLWRPHSVGGEAEETVLTENPDVGIASRFGNARRPRSGGATDGGLNSILSTALVIITLGTIALSLAACASAPKNSNLAPVVVTRSVSPYKMAKLDEAHIKLSAKETVTVTVNQDGMADLKDDYHKVEGMPVEEFRALLVKAYGRSAVIEIVEFRPSRITVLGEVFHQIHTQLDDGPMRVMDAIAAANGFTPLANQKRVKLVRQNAGEAVVYELDLSAIMSGQDLAQNILLKPGDVITVPRNFL